MAVTIGRTSWTDDDGSGTTGTVINNAVKTSVYDQIDAALAQLLPLAGGTMTGANADCSFSRRGWSVDQSSLQQRCQHRRRASVGCGKLRRWEFVHGLLSLCGGLWINRREGVAVWR